MRKHFTPSMIVSLIALTIALSGTAVAASPLITGAQIKDHSIGLVDISNLTVAKLRGKAGPAGPEGVPGNDGVAGPAGLNGGFDPAKVSYATGAAVYVAVGQVVTATAVCPAGTKAIGGGGFNSISQIGASGPTPDGTSWFIIVLNNTPIPVPNVQAFAVCAAR